MSARALYMNGHPSARVSQLEKCDAEKPPVEQLMLDAGPNTKSASVEHDCREEMSVTTVQRQASRSSRVGNNVLDEFVEWLCDQPRRQRFIPKWQRAREENENKKGWGHKGIKAERGGSTDAARAAKPNSGIRILKKDRGGLVGGAELTPSQHSLLFIEAPWKRLAEMRRDCELFRCAPGVVQHSRRCDSALII
ncbi:hypothetical protein Tcan_03873 [Toxocara canis]|uniref:Uncharacterized protein n=1 Tax=Toxocara canis TaxID=6265 RepID=A0A0B2V6S6_TOXCA|nr:hypothetical protein Tcan_03873 [Toxocara canis]